MNKRLSLFVAVLLLLTMLLPGAASAATLDLSYVRDRPDFYTIDPSSDGTALFIESTLTAKDRHFIHTYESDYYWSSTQFDILCLGMNTSDQYPLMRMWIVFANDKSFKKVDSVTIILDGTSYTFTDIDDPENWHERAEQSYIERMLIKFGADNVDFLAAMEKIADRTTDTDTLHAFSCTMILHAENEDITVTLGYNFLLDFILMSPAHRNIGGLDALPRVISTPMTISNSGGSNGGGNNGGGSNGGDINGGDSGPAMCNHCYGTGDCDHCYGEGGEWCDSCFGSGDCSRCDGFGTTFPSERTCTTCRGSGTCKRCNGSGYKECIYCDGSGFCNYCKGVGYR